MGAGIAAARSSARCAPLPSLVCLVRNVPAAAKRAAAARRGSREAAQALLNPTRFLLARGRGRSPAVVLQQYFGLLLQQLGSQASAGCCRRRRGRDPPHPPPLRSPDPHGSAVGSGRGRGGRGVAQRGRAACVQCLKATSSTWGTPGSCVSRGSALGGRTAPETTPPISPPPPQLPAASPPSSFLLFPNSAAPFAAALHALTHLQPRSREDATSRRRFDVVKDKRGRLRVSKGLWGPEAAGLSAERRRPACVGLWEVPEGFCPAAAPTRPWVRLSPRRAACSPERRGERSPREQNSPKRVLKSERSSRCAAQP